MENLAKKAIEELKKGGISAEHIGTTGFPGLSETPFLAVRYGGLRLILGMLVKKHDDLVLDEISSPGIHILYNTDSNNPDYDSRFEKLTHLTFSDIAIIGERAPIESFWDQVCSFASLIQDLNKSYRKKGEK